MIRIDAQKILVLPSMGVITPQLIAGLINVLLENATLQRGAIGKLQYVMIMMNALLIHANLEKVVFIYQFSVMIRTCAQEMNVFHRLDALTHLLFVMILNFAQKIDVMRE